MDLRAARDRLAAEHPADLHAHPRPPGAVGHLPCYVVQDPTEIDYHPTAGDRQNVTLAVRVIVARTADQDGTAELDDLVSTLPDLLQAITPDGKWRGLAITGMTGGYRDFSEGGAVIGVSADLTARITF